MNPDDGATGSSDEEDCPGRSLEMELVGEGRGAARSLVSKMKDKFLFSNFFKIEKEVRHFLLLGNFVMPCRIREKDPSKDHSNKI